MAVDLYWGSTPSNGDREGRLSGYVEPAEASSLPIGKVVLRLPDGYQAAGELAVRSSKWGSWHAFAGPAPYFPARERGLDGHYLVTTGITIGWQGGVSSTTMIETVTARIGITAARTGGSWFCADLTDTERDRVRQELGVAYVEQEIEGHPAPCFHGSAANAIEGEYFVTLREGADLEAAAARLEVETLHVFGRHTTFLARLSPAEIDRVRHDRDVVDLGQNVRVQLD